MLLKAIIICVCVSVCTLFVAVCLHAHVKCVRVFPQCMQIPFPLDNELSPFQNQSRYWNHAPQLIKFMMFCFIVRLSNCLKRCENTVVLLLYVKKYILRFLFWLSVSLKNFCLPVNSHDVATELPDLFTQYETKGNVGSLYM